MPMAIPAIAAYAVSQGVAWAVGSTIIGSIAGAIVSGVLTQALKPDAPDMSSMLDQAGAGRTQAVRQPVAPHQIVAGRVKVSGVYIFVHTMADEGGKENGLLYIVHALAGHKVRAFGSFYFRDTLTTDAAWGTEQVYWRITPHLGEPDQLADADMVAEIGDPHWTEDHRVRGRAYIATLLYWGPEVWASGLPNVSAIVEGVDDIYDPRTGLTGWHNNSALFTARWMTAPWGMGLSWSDLDEASVIAAANDCDERVRVRSSSATIVPIVDDGNYTDEFTLSIGARILDVADGVRLTTSGTLPAPLAVDTTYYVIPSAPYTEPTPINVTTALPEAIKLAATPADAIAGIAINITSGGSGTTTILNWDEARYTLNGQWTLDSPKGQVLEQLLSSMAGVAVNIGGRWSLHAGSAATPTITLTADDLRGEAVWIPKRSMRDRFNGVRAVYVNPDANWQPVDAPLLRNADYLAEDGGEELTEDTRYPFTTSARRVQRLQKIALERNRQQGILQFPAKLTAMRLQAWDGVYVTMDRYGWEQKQFRVIGWTLAEDGGVDLTLQEDDASVYDWDSTEERDSALQQGVVVPDPSEITAPTSIEVTTPLTPTFTSIEATIDEVLTVWYGGCDPEYRNDGTTDWTGYGRVGPDQSHTISVERTTPQDFRARAVTRNGTPSAFTENLAPDAPTGFTVTTPMANNALELDATFSVDTAEAQVFFNSTNTLIGAALAATVDVDDFPWTHTPINGGLMYYWIRAVNASGNFSGLVAGSGTATGGILGGGDDGDGGDA